MHRVTTRVYAEDSDGRKILLYRPGDVIDDREAKRVAAVAESKPGKPGWMVLLERRDAPADETPAKSLDRMKLDELRAVCAAEDIDPAGANTRTEIREVIKAGRAAAGAQTHCER